SIPPAARNGRSATSSATPRQAMSVEVRIASVADKEALVSLFHANEVHYSRERAPTREAVARHLEGPSSPPGPPRPRSRSVRAAPSVWQHLRYCIPRPTLAAIFI